MYVQVCAHLQAETHTFICTPQETYSAERKMGSDALQGRAAFHMLLTSFCYREWSQGSSSHKELALSFFIILSNVSCYPILLGSQEP